MIGEAEPPGHAFPGGAWERESLPSATDLLLAYRCREGFYAHHLNESVDIRCLEVHAPLGYWQQYDLFVLERFRDS